MVFLLYMKFDKIEKSIGSWIFLRIFPEVTQALKMQKMSVFKQNVRMNDKQRCNGLASDPLISN